MALIRLMKNYIILNKLAAIWVQTFNFIAARLHCSIIIILL